ncbi:uncharacterized protein Z518_09237 [Rhinocladiella mackenziei CBS 650.93]|uniref:Rhinocladiella mackenziei CBS 650.93 unplaced genomic scaffold supercont1.7, whole genome shotgun sequence n=1 Tax=Rhinocladiella mackenziei CBS 650.93 TaxID=1442369 RepID=A0A0D2IE61_9EURO|nr:uncharacterized protein Z518_09237 [Rhinocladiella mackenziei CBS 650.93]KIX01511.1 hypothetical protein Z518_09237 [Rhinocladiella mackenziei CBS 650.93]
MYREPLLVSGKMGSVFELSSIITDTRLDFGDEVMDSKAYRRALMDLRHAQNPPGQVEDDQDRPDGPCIFRSKAVNTPTKKACYLPPRRSSSAERVPNVMSEDCTTRRKVDTSSFATSVWASPSFWSDA